MNVFSAYDDAVSRNGVKGQSKANEKAAAGDHKVIKAKSPKAVKEAAKEVAKDEAQVSPKAQKKADAANAEEAAPVKGDIAKNDPNDPVTKEKLKAAINSGMIKFNDSERGVLKDLITE